MMSNPQNPASNAMLNRLRAAVLGANDGIVSTASVVMGVAGATNDKTAVFTAGMAALVAGALSMAVGEYVSVSSQRDVELLHATDEKDEDISSPWEAAIASLVAFTAGGIIPFVAIMLAPIRTSVWIAVAAVVVALFATGYFSATAGGASRRRAVIRVVVGGLLAMGITYVIGVIFGQTVL